MTFQIILSIICVISNTIKWNIWVRCILEKLLHLALFILKLLFWQKWRDQNQPLIFALGDTKDFSSVFW